MRSLPALACLGALILSAAPTAQCSKPSIPPGGLSTVVVEDVPLTYSDGYRTKLVFVRPAGPAPACGWPLVVHVHGWGGGRIAQRGFASRGFVAVSYDVRGQGEAVGLNPPSRGMTLYGATEKFDLAEVVAFVRRQWPQFVSQDRLAVTGASQGGLHAWAAAAWSGQSLSIPGRGSLVFPTVDCVTAGAFVPDFAQHAVRGGTLFSMDFLERVWSENATAVVDPSIARLLDTTWILQLPDAFAGWMASDPGRPVEPLLRTSTVPVLYGHAVYDQLQSPREAVRTLNEIRSGGGGPTVRSMISTNGHNSPLNFYEAVWFEEVTYRWLDRFLWNIQNEVEHEASVVMASVPLNPVRRNDSTYLWPRRFEDSFQPVVGDRWWMTKRGLQATRPARSDAGDTIRHRVAAGYDAVRFLREPALRRTAEVVRNIPISEARYRMPALAEERELIGSPRVHLRLTPTASRYHVAALLIAHPPEGEPVMVSSWGIGERGAVVGRAEDLEFNLSPISTVLPAGTELELVVRNLWLRESPRAGELVTAPYFNSFDLDVQHGPEASWVEVPLRDVPPALLANSCKLPIAAPYDLRLLLKAGSARSGQNYVVFASLSGHSPGTPLGLNVLPLEFDQMTGLLLTTMGTPLVAGISGQLNSNGDGLATVFFTRWGLLPAALSGSQMTFAGWVYDQQLLAGEPTNPVDFALR